MVMEDEMMMDVDLRRYWALLRGWLWLVVLAVFLAGGTAYVVSRWFVEPVYESSVQILIEPSSSFGGSEYQDILAGLRSASTYAEIIRSRPILEKTLAKIGYSEAEIKHFDAVGPDFDVSVSPLQETQLVEVSVESPDPTFAQNLAEGLVQTFIADNQQRQSGRFERAQQEVRAEMDAVEEELAQVSVRLETTEDAAERSRLERRLVQLQDTLSRLSAAYQNVTLSKLDSVDLISVVENARYPERPIRPRTSMNALLGGIVGGMVAVGGVFLADFLDTSVKTPEEAEALAGSPVLSNIWYEKDIVSSNGVGAKVVLEKPLSLTSEAFRLLRANLQFASVDTPLRTLLITSPGPTEGKSTISLNLALALGISGKRVILIDADMRKPKLHQYAETEREPGLSNALVDADRELGDYLVPIVGTEVVTVLPAGKVPPNPAELLGSQRMGALLARCQSMSDIVIVDSPPVLAAADAVLC
jgi:polysaccharide biosynthesis transport protein